MSEIYSSIQQDSTTQIKVEGSRFIADVLPAKDETTAKQKLVEIKKKYFDATHHCYAYVIGADGQHVRYSDDGEPSGTAGIKIFNAIQSKKLSDILVIVTRYFGGTKLGVGGLSRAYYEAAETALQKAKVITKAELREVKLSFPFECTNPVMNIIHSQKITISETRYLNEQPELILDILPSKIESLKSLFENATRGNSKFEVGITLTKIIQ